MGLREEIELVRGASHDFDLDAFLAGKMTPVFFGSAMNNFGITELMDSFVEIAPAPQPRARWFRAPGATVIAVRVPGPPPAAA